MFVEQITIDLASSLEVHRTDSVKHTGGVIASWVSYLSSMSRIVQEICGTRLTYEPIDSRLLQLAKLNKTVFGSDLRVYYAQSGCTAHPCHHEV